MGDDGRISKLPDAVIIHILSFLPTEDVVRTCLLSKRWKLLWYSVPTLFFSNHTTNDVEKFYNYVDNCLEHRNKAFIVDSVITSFKLKMFDCYHGSKAGLLDKWLAFAVENKIKEIYLSIGQEQVSDSNFIDYYCLPKILDNARYLTILELNGVKLDTSYSFSFPFLKTLSLEDVWQSHTAEEDGVVRFLLGCPSLEKLRLHDYVFLRTNVRFQLQSLSLKFMELISENYDYDVQIQVDAINLESLVVESISLDQINLSSCKKIRNLTLSNVYCMNNNHPSSLEVLMSNIPLIENLTLSICNPLKSEHLKIPSQYLKSFCFDNCTPSCGQGVMKVVTLESAPNLAYFCYVGNINFSISMESSSGSLNGEFIILEGQRDYDTKWYTDMMNFLVNLKCSWNIVTLHVSTYKALIWPENLKNICRYPLLNWKHLRVITNCCNPCKPENESDLKDALMWISPSLETLSINEKVIF
ncbi:F-box/LRR-repeat protein At3g26922-like [Humulus lupulus]|uniref:F-box/LRR-repeat protein At3g26922-like n=1 Tax=Humulus lupulus TaxID=3486 RepID=UPI002B40AFBF|nr:F-box/LRR-repeat protein At3g26922-like [Humulus lupulus]XP_062082935.1 F-box/LRR-repeat protein At3g26922-like [Humulus lupulus]